jgi:NodT family efflux transporter outer membrane factor (OMF) lipoprotein
MLQGTRRVRAAFAAAAAMVLALSGCTSLRDYVRQGFKVGPDYCRPPAPVAEHWLDTGEIVKERSADLSQWWTVFNDSTLNSLITDACRQNLSLREAGFRVLEARAQLGIAAGNLFPQRQTADGSYRRLGAQQVYTDQWSFGFNLAWELDFWGKFRRAVAAADAQLDASVESYDAVLVTLLGDVASNYVQFRTDQERIRLLRKNALLQEEIMEVAESKADIGAVDELDPDQARSSLKQSEAAIEALQVDLRQTSNRLCILLGIPPEDLQKRLGTDDIPTTPPEVAVGIPADLLRRRPDVRRAERLAAAQAEQIGIAQADLYPTFSISGTLGWQAAHFAGLFSQDAFTGSVGPSFQWNILNYGRIANNVRFQDAQFQELVVTYQNTVLQANEEVENGLITFLQAQKRAVLLDESRLYAQRAVDVIVAKYEAGIAGVDFNRYAVIEQTLINQEDLWAQARGQIAQGLIQVYRALGGGWEVRLQSEGAAAGASATLPANTPQAPEVGIAPPAEAPEPPQPQAAPAPPKPAAQQPPAGP